MARMIRKLPPAARFDGLFGGRFRGGLARIARTLRGPARMVGRFASGLALKRPRASAAFLSAGVLGLALWHAVPEVFWAPPLEQGSLTEKGQIGTARVGPEHIGTEGPECLALNIYHEARGEPEKGRVAVAQVVLNRVLDSRFPDTICAVVKQEARPPRRECQFSWWCDGRSDKPADISAWEKAKAVAGDVLAGRHDDPTGGALWYHADTAAPKWRTAFAPAGKIGRHHFYLPVAATSH